MTHGIDEPVTPLQQTSTIAPFAAETGATSTIDDEPALSLICLARVVSYALQPSGGA
jgi:hypothetical protein